MHPATLVDPNTQLSYVLLHSDVDKGLVHVPVKDSANEPPNVCVICCHGSGQGPHIDYWLPLMREISKHTKVLCYERRKIGQNTMAVSRSQTPEEAVSDLDALLKALQLRPPYILIAHSYGGAIARQFLQWHPTQVAGMVLAETGQETPIKHEAEQYKKQILGSKPLSVIHADSLLGKRGGSTSAEELRLRDLWAAEDERLKRAQLGLSSNARYVRVDDCGHDIIDERPHIVAAEVSWVLENQVPASVQLQQQASCIGSYFQRLVRLLQWRKEGEGDIIN